MYVDCRDVLSTGLKQVVLTTCSTSAIASSLFFINLIQIEANRLAAT